MGSDEESRFNVSVGSDGQSHRTVSTNHNFLKRKVAEAVSNRGPSAYQPNALPLGLVLPYSTGGLEGSPCIFKSKLFRSITGAYVFTVAPRV